MRVSNFFLDKSKNKTINFFGINHSNKDLKQIEDLKKNLEEFNPDLVLIEGGYENANFENEEIAISKGGELGFVSYYTKNKKIPLLGNDPPEKLNINFLNSIYGKDFSFFYFVLRNLDYFSKMGIISFDDSGLLFVLEDFKFFSEWEDYDFSIIHFKNMFLDFLGEEFSFSKSYSDYISSLSKISILRNATNKLSLYRDFYLFQIILDNLDKYKRIFIVKGESHLEIFENYFKTFFDD